jgi:hypothetical protein
VNRPDFDGDSEVANECNTMGELVAALCQPVWRGKPGSKEVGRSGREVLCLDFRHTGHSFRGAYRRGSEANPAWCDVDSCWPGSRAGPDDPLSTGSSPIVLVSRPGGASATSPAPRRSRHHRGRQQRPSGASQQQRGRHGQNAPLTSPAGGSSATATEAPPLSAPVRMSTQRQIGSLGSKTSSTAGKISSERAEATAQ